MVGFTGLMGGSVPVFDKVVLYSISGMNRSSSLMRWVPMVGFSGWVQWCGSANIRHGGPRWLAAV